MVSCAMAVNLLAARDGLDLAYEFLPGNAPAVVFLPGFASDMDGTKALFLRQVCAESGQAMLRLDYSGHGRSAGRFEDGSIGRWTEDAACVIEAATAGMPLLLAGSSMGGWIALLLAMQFTARMRALLLIAPAPDFTEWGIRPKLSARELRALETAGMFHAPSTYGAPLPITAKLLEDGRNHLLLKGEISISCPVAILHGMEDADVPWANSLELVGCLKSAAVETTFIKDGDHRLSRPGDLSLLAATLRRLLGQDGAEALPVGGIPPGQS